jgi:prophage regulatory protein
MAEKLLRRRDVEARTALSRSTIYAWVTAGTFPKPMKLGAKKVAWRESDVAAWLDARKPRAA